MPNWGLSEYNEIKVQITYFYLIYKAFLKKQMVWN